MCIRDRRRGSGGGAPGGSNNSMAAPGTLRAGGAADRGEVQLLHPGCNIQVVTSTLLHPGCYIQVVTSALLHPGCYIQVVTSGLQLGPRLDRRGTTLEGQSPVGVEGGDPHPFDLCRAAHIQRPQARCRHALRGTPRRDTWDRYRS
eukprot:194531-Prorocentrum_minimum.AAC.4